MRQEMLSLSHLARRVGMTDVVIVAHGTQLLTVALDADENLVVQIKGTVGRLDLLESQLSPTVDAA